MGEAVHSGFQPFSWRRWWRGVRWVLFAAVLLAVALQRWQAALDDKAVALTLRWLQAGEDATELLRLPSDPEELAKLRAIQQDVRDKRVVKIETWGPAMWLTLCVAEAAAYVIEMDVHVDGARITDLASGAGAQCREKNGPPAQDS